MPPAGVIRRRPCRRRWLSPTFPVYRQPHGRVCSHFKPVRPLERLSRFRREQNQLLRQRLSRGGFSGNADWLFRVFRNGNINTAAAAASCRKFRELPVRGGAALRVYELTSKMSKSESLNTISPSPWSTNTISNGGLS